MAALCRSLILHVENSELEYSFGVYLCILPSGKLRTTTHPDARTQVTYTSVHLVPGQAPPLRLCRASTASAPTQELGPHTGGLQAGARSSFGVGGVRAVQSGGLELARGGNCQSGACCSPALSTAAPHRARPPTCMVLMQRLLWMTNWLRAAERL